MFKLATSLTIVLGAMAATTAQAQSPIVLRIADQFPLQHIASRLSIQPLIQKVEERSNGRIRFQHFPAEQLAKSGGMLDAVKTGVADMALQVAGSVTDRIPLTGVVELPTISQDILECYKVFQTMAEGPLYEKEYKSQGVRAIEVTCTPAQFLVTRQEIVDNVGKLKGMKLRAGSSAVELTLTELGAVPVKLGAPDVYISVDRGTLDGAIFGAAATLGYKLEKMVKGTARNVNFGSLAAILFINERKFNSLPPDLQKLLVDVGREVGRDVAIAYSKESEESLAALEKAGVKVYDFPEPVVAEIRKAQDKVANEWVKQLEARRLPGKDVYDTALRAK